MVQTKPIRSTNSAKPAMAATVAIICSARERSGRPPISMVDSWPAKVWTKRMALNTVSRAPVQKGKKPGAGPSCV